MSVVVVGSINMDVVARVSRIPGPGETVLATDSSRGGGGKGANQVVAAARAGGVQTAFVGAVGDDGDGASLRRALEADGIDTTGMETVALPTGTALISVADDGENAIVVIPGANRSVAALSSTQRRLVEEADVVVAQLEIPVSGVLEAASARKTDAVFVLNAAPSAPLTDPVTAERLLAATDVLVVNEHELGDIAGAIDAALRNDVDRAVEALAARVPALVVTFGAAGALIAVGTERRSIPAFAVEAIDTTGAGDTYCGVLAAHLSGGRSALTIDALAAGARAGAAASALTVGRVGAQTAVPTTIEVAEFLEDAS